MWKMIKLFDDMPDGFTEVGMKLLLPDLMTVEMKAKTDGYPKAIQLVLLYFVNTNFESLKRRKEHDREENEGREGEAEKDPNDSN